MKKGAAPPKTRTKPRFSTALEFVVRRIHGRAFTRVLQAATQVGIRLAHLRVGRGAGHPGRLVAFMGQGQAGFVRRVRWRCSPARSGTPRRWGFVGHAVAGSRCAAGGVWRRLGGSKFGHGVLSCGQQNGFRSPTVAAPQQAVCQRRGAADVGGLQRLRKARMPCLSQAGRKPCPNATQPTTMGCALSPRVRRVWRAYGSGCAQQGQKGRRQWHVEFMGASLSPCLGPNFQALDRVLAGQAAAIGW